MKKGIFAIATIIFLTILLASCEYLQTMNTTAVKNMRSDIMDKSASVYKVKVTWIANQAFIDVFLKAPPTKQVENSIFDRVKEFPTYDTIEEGTGMLIDYVNYRLYVDNNKTDPYLQYTTQYYNSNDSSDQSPSNINGYKVWTARIMPVATQDALPPNS